MSPLYNPTRNLAALNFTDLGGCNADSFNTTHERQECNLRLMKRQFAAASNSKELFFGKPYHDGSPPFPGGGILEGAPHSSVHLNTGYDMARLVISGLDPLFHVHHANIDRLWAIWAAAHGGDGRKFVDDPDFLDSSFLFWDENMQLVRIRVRDCIDSTSLGYAYEDVEIQWRDVEMKVEEVPALSKAIAGRREIEFPVKLSTTVTVEVERSRGVKGEEKVVVGEIEFDGREHVWFDVYVGSVGGGEEPVGRRVLAGCFVHMARKASRTLPVKTNLQIGISEFVNAIGAAGADQVALTLVPKRGGEGVSIGKIWIE